MYSEFFKLTSHPFQAAIERGVFFPFAGATQSMATLQHGLISGDRLLVLTGSAGSGKTCLATKLISELSANVRCIFLQSVYDSDTELLQGLAVSLSLDTEKQDKLILFEMVINEFQRLSTIGEKVLLVIDNAQFLGTGCLKMISVLTDFQSVRNYSLVVLLVGRSEIIKNLIKSFGSLRDQQFKLTSTIRPLSRLDTTSYIKYRLSKAGMDEQKLFNTRTVKQIYNLTNGVPRRINALCDVAMLAAYANQSNRITETHIAQASSRLGWNFKTEEFAPIKIPGLGGEEVGSKRDKVAVQDVMGNSVSYYLCSGVMRVGRAQDCEIRLNEINISRYQAEIIGSESGYSIVNKGSLTPVMLNGQSIESERFKDGDIMSIGNYTFEFTIPTNKDEAVESNSEDKQLVENL